MELILSTSGKAAPRYMSTSSEADIVVPVVTDIRQSRTVFEDYSSRTSVHIELDEEQAAKVAAELLSKLGVFERLTADLRHHSETRDRLAEELSDLDEPYDGATDNAEGYAAGRVAAMHDAIEILLGRETTLYSETPEAATE